MTIEFPFGEYWQPLQNFVGFRAMVNNDRLDCHMEQKALVRYFKGKGKDPLEVFKANRKAIEAVARRMIEARKTDAEGPMAMSVDDFKK
jgi:uncharacterized protein DUF1488